MYMDSSFSLCNNVVCRLICTFLKIKYVSTNGWLKVGHSGTQIVIKKQFYLQVP